MKKLKSLIRNSSHWVCPDDKDVVQLNVNKLAKIILNNYEPIIKNNIDKEVKKWGTHFIAKHAITEELRKFTGSLINAPSKSLAQLWCQENAGHLIVDDEVVATINAVNGEQIDSDIDRN